MISKEEFKSSIKENAGISRKLHPELRFGQAVFNCTDQNIARLVQFDYGIDCFYDDEQIDKFLDKCYELYKVFNDEE
jgi:hypothetical protein